MGCDDDIQIKRQVMEILVAGIRVDTKGAGRAKQVHVTISDSFTPKRVVLSNTEKCATLPAPLDMSRL
jgi:hypothetical protein